MLSLNRISKNYKIGTFGGKDFTAVRDVSFELAEGEVVSLIGESGSGKTTVGKMILKLIDISSGSIVLDGVDVSTVKGKDVKGYSARTTRSSRRTASSPSSESSISPRWLAPSGMTRSRQPYGP